MLAAAMGPRQQGSSRVPFAGCQALGVMSPPRGGTARGISGALTLGLALLLWLVPLPTSQVGPESRQFCCGLARLRGVSGESVRPDGEGLNTGQQSEVGTA